MLDGRAGTDPATLETISDSLGLSRDKLFRLAGIKPENPPFVLPPEFAALEPEQRRHLVALGREFLRLLGRREPQENVGTVTPIGRQRVTEAAWDVVDDPPHGAGES